MSTEPRIPSVVDGELRRCSVSQLKSFDASKKGGCERRWAWQKVWHIDEEGGKGAKDSTKCHTIAETYLKEGFLPLGTNDLERSFLAGKHMLPERDLDLTAEAKFDGEVSLAGVPFNGKIDLVIPRSDLPEEVGFSMEVGDHKFHGDITRALTEEEMRNDPQMLGYGMVMMAWYPNLTHVRLTHYNYQKTKPFPSRKVSIILSVEEIRTRWASLEALVVRMKRTAGAKNPSEVPANRASCLAYGKSNACPHLQRCEGVKDMAIFSAEEEAVFGVSAPAIIEGALPANYRYVECEVCGMPMTSHGKRPPGHKISPELCANKATHEFAANPPQSPVAVLPPDAPASDPDLAAACPSCEEEKNFQHKPADCPKASEPAAAPGKRKRRSKSEIEAARMLELGASITPVDPPAPQPEPAASVAPTLPDVLVVKLPEDIEERYWREARNELARELLLEAVRSGVSPTEVIGACFDAANAFMERSKK